MLIPPQRAAHLVIFKISIRLCRSRSKKLNRMPLWFNLQLLLQRSRTQLTSFQNPQTLWTISSGHDVIHTPALLPVWGVIIANGDCHILSAQAQLHQMTMHLD